MLKLYIAVLSLVVILSACGDGGATVPDGGGTTSGSEKIIISTASSIDTGKGDPVTLSATAYYTNEELGTSTMVPASNFAWKTASEMSFNGNTNNNSVVLTSSSEAGIFSRTVTVTAWINGVSSEKTVTINHSVDWAPVALQPNIHAECLRISSAGDIIIATRANVDDIVVKKYDGNGWQAYPALKGNVSMTSFMDIDQGGTPHVVIDKSVYKYSSGTWTVLGGQPFHGTGVYYPQVAIASNGHVYVSFADSTNDHKAKVMKYDGISWSQVGLSGISGGNITYNNMKFLYGVVPYITFDYTQGSDRFVTVQAYYGGAWHTVGQQQVSVGYGMWTQLYVSPNNKLYVFFADGGTSGSTTVKRMDGSSWTTIGTAIGTSISGSIASSLHVTPSGETYFTYYRSGLHALKLNGNIWESIGTFQPGEGDLYPKIFSLPDGYTYLLSNKFMRLW